MRARYEKHYAKRLRLAKKLERQTESCLRNQCGNKVQHDNFLSAMLHAHALTLKTKKLYYPYSCEDCGFTHVGHDENSNSVVWMMDGFSVKVVYANGVLETMPRL